MIVDQYWARKYWAQTYWSNYYWPIEIINVSSYSNPRVEVIDRNIIMEFVNIRNIEILSKTIKGN